MPPPEFVFATARSGRWDGTNGAQIAAALDKRLADGGATWTVDSETPTALALRQSAQGVSALWFVRAATPWVIVVAGVSGILETLSDADYAAKYTTLAEMKQLVGVNDLPTALLNSPPWITALRNRLGLPPA